MWRLLSASTVKTVTFVSFSPFVPLFVFDVVVLSNFKRVNRMSHLLSLSWLPNGGTVASKYTEPVSSSFAVVPWGR